MNELFIDIQKNSTDEDIRIQDIIPFLRESDTLLILGYEEKESFLYTKTSIGQKFPIQTIFYGYRESETKKEVRVMWVN